MWKKTLIALSVASMGLGAVTVAKAAGSITFTGTISAAGCETNVRGIDTAGTVNFGDHSVNYFSEMNRKSNSVPFAIGLTGCDASAVPKVVFKQSTHLTDAFETSIDGLGIIISEDMAGTKLFQPNIARSHPDWGTINVHAENTAIFYSALKSHSTGTKDPGRIDTVITFDVIYS